MNSLVTSSEIIVTATIWLLAAAGGFFGIRAALRRNKAKRSGKNSVPGMK